MIPIVDLFVSIQGEGMYAGQPSIFIRTSGCNLKCVFGESICDTPYTSFNAEKNKYTYEDVKKMIDDNPQINHVVITGGEPLLWGKEMPEFINSWVRDCMTITIETNGTMPPFEIDTNAVYRVLYSISPKLSTAMAKPGQTVKIGDKEHTFTQEEVDKLNLTRYNPANIAKIFENLRVFDPVQLKYVYTNDDTIKEIEMLNNEINTFLDGSDHAEWIRRPEDFTFLMPEGITREQIQKNGMKAVEWCIKKGWTYTDRLHIQLWGDKRGY